VTWPESEAWKYLRQHRHGNAREIMNETGQSMAATASRLAKLCAQGRTMRRHEPGGFRYWIAGEEPPPVGVVEPPGAALRPETVIVLALAYRADATEGEICEFTTLDLDEVRLCLDLLERCDAVTRDGHRWKIRT
jgi:hypothetical protein